MGRTTVASEGGGRWAAGEGEGHGGGRLAAGDGVGVDPLLTDASLGTGSPGVTAIVVADLEGARVDHLREARLASHVANEVARAAAGRRGAAHAAVRAHPVPAEHRSGPRGAAAHHPADDQQVLRRRPCARPQPGRVPRRLRPAASSTTSTRERRRPLMDRATAALALSESHRRGYLDGRALAGVFAWLRPNDLVWNYWVNDYLLGKDPPPFDILYWNADTTNMPAALHRDFVEIALSNALTEPGVDSGQAEPASAVATAR